MAMKTCPRCGKKYEAPPSVKKFCSKTCWLASLSERVSPSQCSVRSCDRQAVSKGWCRKHYARKLRGKPVEVDFDPLAPRGPYKGRKNAKMTYENRVAARAELAPLCECGCGKMTEFSVSKNRYLIFVRGHYRKALPYKDRDWIEREYVKLGRTLDDIGTQFNVRGTSVRHAIEKMGIGIRTQAESLRLSGKVSGKNNPAWKGGTTPERQRLYKSYEWRKLVQSIFERDGFACQRCGDRRNSPGNRFHGHHITPWSLAQNLRTNPDNLVTLCKSCHLWVHSNSNVDLKFLKIPEDAIEQ